MVLAKDVIFKYGTAIKIFLMDVPTTTLKRQPTGLRFNHIFVKSSETLDTLSLLRNWQKTLDIWNKINPYAGTLKEKLVQPIVEYNYNLNLTSVLSLLGAALLVILLVYLC